uniref:Clathrin binding box of aftiphilin containing 1 n=1 Tax=Canis lupus familiaris TaxID=9615 RepID=A0A8C0PX32_CANLF
MTFTPPPCCRLLPRTLWAGGGTPEPCLVGRPGQHLPDITALGLRFGHSSRCRSQKARPRPRCKALPHCSKTQRPCLQNGDTSLCHWTTQGKLPARTLETLATRAGTWPLRPASAVGGRAHSRSQLALSYADVFRFAFQEVLVPQAAEGISPLDHVLDASGEGKPGCEPVHTLCSESRELWRALQNTNGMSASRCLWSKSRCQENFFLVLGIDAAQKDLSGDLGHIPECSDLKEPEEAGAPSRLQPCRALIQTKVSRPPGQARGPPWWHLRPEAHGLGTNGHCRCPEAAEHLEGSRCHRTAGRQQGLQGSRGAGAPEAQGRGARPGAPPTPF